MRKGFLECCWDIAVLCNEYVDRMDDRLKNGIDGVADCVRKLDETHAKLEDAVKKAYSCLVKENEMKEGTK